MVWWDTLFVLNLALHVVDCVGALHFQCDSLPGKGLDENLHTTTEAEDQVESRLFLDVVVGKSTAILELLAGENEALLVWWNAFLVCAWLAGSGKKGLVQHALDLGLDIVNGI